MRSDVIRAIQDMGGARILRWPGGNFASYYRWKDGIGPREKRPRRFDVVWRNYESNHFGTDEYLALCRKLNCEPFITVNMGNGGLEEACEWVEYCRRDKRQPAVRVWGLGNETYGPWQVGHSSAAEYARKAKQFGQFMRAVEPDLQYVGVGHKDEAWNDAVLKGCGSLLDWLSIHLYAHRHFLDGEDDYDSTVAAPAVFERSMRNMADQIAEWERTSPRQKPLQICLEEWNVRHFKKGAQNAVNPGLWARKPAQHRGCALRRRSFQRLPETLRACHDDQLRLHRECAWTAAGATGRPHEVGSLRCVQTVRHAAAACGRTSRGALRTDDDAGARSCRGRTRPLPDFSTFRLHAASTGAS